MTLLKRQSLRICVDGAYLLGAFSWLFIEIFNLIALETLMLCRNDLKLLYKHIVKAVWVIIPSMKPMIISSPSHKMYNAARRYFKGLLRNFMNGDVWYYCFSPKLSSIDSRLVSRFKTNASFPD